jgi:diguanylate cyclase (GGDEF)-like protein
VFFPHTYRFRLVAYITVLLIFLLAVLAVSYHDSRALILQETENNLGRVVQQIEGQLGYKALDHSARAKMIRDNVPLTEYLFITASLDTDAGAIRELYKRQFDWLPTDRVVLLARNAKPMLGAEYADLSQALRARGAPKEPLDEQFYFYGKNGLELVSAAAVKYRSQYLGVVAITESLGAKWMTAVRQLSNGHLVMAKDDKIILSTLDGQPAGAPFIPQSDIFHVGSEEYLTRQIHLTNTDPGLPTLWFLQSTAELTARINRQRNQMLVLAAIGGLDILLVGFLMLRNFSAPLKRLVAATKEVSEGRLPEVPETTSRDEIGYLWNHFSAMVHSLHDKQEEISRVHAELERLATTDALTGLYNRRYLADLFPKLSSNAQRHGKALTVIAADIDKFKGINDKYGHLVGDHALVHFSTILKECTRISDFVFRTGGEEFLILVPGDIDSGAALAEKIRSTLENTPLVSNELTIAMTASFGVAQMETSEDIQDSMGILSSMSARADELLYSAKQAGRNRVMGGNATEPPRAVANATHT